MQDEESTATPTVTQPAVSEWSSTNVYVLGLICLLLGVAVGAILHGPQKAQAGAAAVAAAASVPSSPMPSQPMPNQTPAADDPVFAQLQRDPNNFDLLGQAGVVSMRSGKPADAVNYFSRALKVKDDLDTRVNLANAYFRSGNPDQSLAELAQVLKKDPKNDKALYNTGSVKLMGKNDPKGAIESWQLFLKYHPDHPHKAQVEEMIRRVKKSFPS